MRLLSKKEKLQFCSVKKGNYKIDKRELSSWLRVLTGKISYNCINSDRSPLAAQLQRWECLLATEFNFLKFSILILAFLT